MRWSSAKGIGSPSFLFLQLLTFVEGRIASRLPRAFADDIVEHVLSLFNPLIEMADSGLMGSKARDYYSPYLTYYSLARRMPWYRRTGTKRTAASFSTGGHLH